MSELRDALRQRFEIGAHPLRLVDLEARAPVRRLRFETARGEPVAGTLLEPAAAGPAPAILYIHAHGGRYDIGAAELLDGRDALQGPLGPVLAAAGFRVLAIDLPCFGTRAGIGEGAAAKAAQWWGGSLAGQMLGELAAALDWLAADPGTDPARIGAFGISMGATLGYWLAAVEPRLAAVAQLCCFADFAPLIASGAHDRHGHYLTVPGLLRIASNGEIAGLVAPRPQFVGLRRRQGVEEPTAGHEETPAMRVALLAFLAGALGPVS